MEELTCRCLIDLGPYIKGHEYQVDVYPLFCCVYQNGGWKDYVFLDHDVFNKHFEYV